MSEIPVTDLSSDRFAVIDLDTGTVLGTNVALVRLPDDEHLVEIITGNDSKAHEYANNCGVSLRVSAAWVAANSEGDCYRRSPRA